MSTKLAVFRVSFELVVPVDQEDGVASRVRGDFESLVREGVEAEIDDALSAGEMGSGALLVEDAADFEVRFVEERTR